MNIRCPQCQTVFRVNPERIPPRGVRARCARCGGTFMVQLPSTPPAAGSTEAPAPAATGSTPPADAGASRPEPAASTQRPAARVEPQPAAAPEPWPGTTATEERSARPAFGSRDPNARAARLARALVSDIVAYHPERRDESLAAGRLRTAFREEIMKSWEEYVAQVGADLAKSTPYFRDALNEILAKGEKIF
jgi:predicted Zn finger-like uncharacterized protein